MQPETFLAGRVALWRGDVRAALAAMEPDSADCVVTSPPYWGLRDYGVEGQIGLEPSLGEHLEVMVDVFRAVRRVLKPTGTLWINYGDCYATTPNGRSAADCKAAGGDDRTFRDKPFSTVGGVLKPKDLCMVPNRLAIALQEDGWWVRSEIVWGKTNPMPDSVKDRPGTAHEKIFLLSKSARYYYDSEAVRFGLRPKTYSTYGSVRSPIDGDGLGKVKKVNMARSMPVRQPRASKQDQTAASASAAKASSGRRMAGFNARWDAAEKVRASDLADPRHAGGINHTGIDATPRGEGRNLRNYEPAPPAPLEVWPMATRPFADAHFATFPPDLAARCILAGCPPGGLVLDPFGGAGTTGLVALRLGRTAALIEINDAYADMARRRIERDWMGEAERQRATARARPEADAGPLFAGAAAEKEPAQ